MPIIGDVRPFNAEPILQAISQGRAQDLALRQLALQQDNQEYGRTQDFISRGNAQIRAGGEALKQKRDFATQLADQRQKQLLDTQYRQAQMQDQRTQNAAANEQHANELASREKIAGMNDQRQRDINTESVVGREQVARDAAAARNQTATLANQARIEALHQRERNGIEKHWNEVIDADERAGFPQDYIEDLKTTRDQRLAEHDSRLPAPPSTVQSTAQDTPAAQPATSIARRPQIQPVQPATPQREPYTGTPRPYNGPDYSQPNAAVFDQHPGILADGSPESGIPRTGQPILNDGSPAQDPNAALVEKYPGLLMDGSPQSGIPSDGSKPIQLDGSPDAAMPNDGEIDLTNATIGQRPQSIEAKRAALYGERQKQKDTEHADSLKVRKEEQDRLKAKDIDAQTERQRKIDEAETTKLEKKRGPNTDMYIANHLDVHRGSPEEDSQLEKKEAELTHRLPADLSKSPALREEIVLLGNTELDRLGTNAMNRSAVETTRSDTKPGGAVERIGRAEWMKQHAANKSDNTAKGVNESVVLDEIKKRRAELKAPKPAETPSTPQATAPATPAPVQTDHKTTFGDNLRTMLRGGKNPKPAETLGAPATPQAMQAPTLTNKGKAAIDAAIAKGVKDPEQLKRIGREASAQ